MKTKTNSILFFAFLCSSALLFNSCTRRESNCGWENTTNVNQNLSDFNKVSYYTGHDTLVFISNAGDTATLYGQGKQTYFDLTNSGISNADCGSTPQYTYHNENLDLVFSGSDNDLYKIEYHGYFDLAGQETNLTVDTETGSWGITPEKITIKGIEYDCVYSSLVPHTYYSFQFGILRIDSINGKNWTLNKLP